MKPWLIFGAGHGVGAHLLALANQHADNASPPLRHPIDPQSATSRGTAQPRSDRGLW